MKEFLKSLLASVLGTFLAGALCAFLLLVLIVAGLSASGGGAPTVTVRPGTLLVVGHGLVVNDTPAHGKAGLGALLGDEPRPTVDLYRALTALELAAKDRNIVGVVIAGEIEAGVVQLGELRQAIAAFRKESGKPVFAWIENGSQGEYYLASVADQVAMHPSGELELKGLAANNLYFGETLRTLGIGVQVTKVGKYKSAVEPFLGDRMSEPSREQATQLVQGVWSRLVGQIAQSRKLTNAALNRAADAGGIFPAKKALALKLVDALQQRDEFIERARKAGAAVDDSETSFRQVSLARYADKVQLPRGADKVAVVYAEGEIVDGWGGPGLVGGDRLARDLRVLRGDKSVKAVVLRVNSPGGSAFASDVVAREVGLLKAQGIPVVVSMGDVAASGGYYMGCVGDSIFALPNTITGSIGVFALLPNTQQLFGEKLGLNYETVELGELSAGWRPDRPLGEKERAVMQTMINEIYNDFLNTVAEGRNMSKSNVAALAEGRVYSAIDAKELHLIDDFGGINRAILAAARKSKTTEYRVVSYPEQEDWLSQLLNKEEMAKTQWAMAAKASGLPIETIKEAEKIQHLVGPQYLLPWSVKMH